jgi:hypothetical protein
MLQDLDDRLLWIEVKLGVPMSEADRLIAKEAMMRRWRLRAGGPESLTPPW